MANMINNFKSSCDKILKIVPPYFVYSAAAFGGSPPDLLRLVFFYLTRRKIRCGVTSLVADLGALSLVFRLTRRSQIHLMLSSCMAMFFCLFDFLGGLRID